MNQPTRYWNQLHAIVMLAAAAMALSTGDLAPMLAVSIASFCILLLAGFRQIAHLRPWGGIANWITLLRLAILLFAVWRVDQLPTEVFLALSLLVVSADALDGYVARRLKQETAFGAILDLEVDALFGALFAVLAWKMFGIGAWILIAGLLRYGFVVLLTLLGWNRRPKVAMKESKTIAVLFFIALLTPFVLPSEIAQWMLLFASAAIMYSFGKELILLARRPSG
ncbi:MAG: CDP-alcohol phosphatidyltransferase family protein [Saprospiraceae bacterium]|nr:CDP-alcohol phosphatidyltransferase family protein [Saprospiraceae bacterium]